MAKSNKSGTSITFVVTGLSDGSSIALDARGVAVFHPSPDSLREWIYTTWLPVLHSSDAISSDVVAPQERLKSDRQVDDSPVYCANDILHDNR